MKLLLVIAALVIFALTNGGNAAEDDTAGYSCASIADADAQDAENAAEIHVSVLQLTDSEVSLFNEFAGFNKVVDVVTLFIFPDRHSEFAIGSKEQDVKCLSQKFRFSKEQTKLMLLAVYGRTA
jgi:hypothetical protein